MSETLYQRVVCLSTEAVEVMYELGLEDRIVGISGYTTRPARARQEKPKVSGFSSAKLDRILAVEPDLVIAYSNMQAELSRELIAAGVEVHCFNQHDLQGLFRMILSVSRLFDCVEKGQTLVRDLKAQIAQVKQASQTWQRRPRVYFEEWDSPMISAIAWVSELISIAGGDDIFADKAVHHHASKRIIETEQAVLAHQPDIIIGSWCGKKFRPEALSARVGWCELPALRQQQVFEIKSPDILSPGPAAIREGLMQLHRYFQRWQAQVAKEF